MTTFALIHSPLVGPITWKPVAEELRQRGVEAVVPTLSTDPADQPYWNQHVRRVTAALEALPATGPIILVSHSGAGVLLPAIRQMMQRPIGGYIYVDSGLPKDGASRLELFGSPEEANEFRMAAQDGLLPMWTDDDLREVIPDDRLRREFVAELRPLPLAVYEEPIPVFENWPDAPCGYLLFSETYRDSASVAQRNGWPYVELPNGHFQMLNDPAGVAEILLDLAKKMSA